MVAPRGGDDAREGHWRKNRGFPKGSGSTLCAICGCNLWVQPSGQCSGSGRQNQSGMGHDEARMYLEKRFNTWMAFQGIPERLRPVLGGTRQFAASLDTDDKTIAQIRAIP